jgi:hypothetical protein
MHGTRHKQDTRHDSRHTQDLEGLTLFDYTRLENSAWSTATWTDKFCDTLQLSWEEEADLGGCM